MELITHPFDLRLTHTWKISSNAAEGGKDSYPAVFIQLRGPDGTAGFGEASPSTRYDETAQTALEFLQRIDPARLSFDDLAGSMRYVESIAPGNYSPKGAVNTALLDGASRQARQPLHQFLGLGVPDG